MRCAIDRKQREAAGLDRAEDQHGGGGGRHQPDEADEAGRLILAVREMSGLSRQAASTGMAATATSPKVTPKGKKPWLPICAKSQGPPAKPSDSTVA